LACREQLRTACWVVMRSKLARGGPVEDFSKPIMYAACSLGDGLRDRIEHRQHGGNVDIGHRHVADRRKYVRLPAADPLSARVIAAPAALMRRDVAQCAFLERLVPRAGKQPLALDAALGFERINAVEDQTPAQLMRSIARFG